MKAATLATMILCASAAAADAQTPVALHESARLKTVCLVDSAFGFDEKTPTQCFTMRGAIGQRAFWRSFVAAIAKPGRIDDVDAFYDIRSGSAVIGRDQTADLAPDARHALNVCWARLDRARMRGEKPPNPVCD